MERRALGAAVARGVEEFMIGQEIVVRAVERRRRHDARGRRDHKAVFDGDRGRTGGMAIRRWRCSTRRSKRVSGDDRVRRSRRRRGAVSRPMWASC
jgi:hypothetical protein